MSSSGLQPLQNAFSGFTRLSKGIAVLLAVGFLVVTVLPWALEYVALVPGKSIPMAWNLLTAGYIEKSLLSAIVNVLAVLFIGKTLEPIWGSKEFLKFIVLVNLFTGASTFATMIFLYFCTMNEDFLYPKISGFHGVVAGFLVAIKQLMPDQEITAFFVFKFRAKHVPSLFVLVSVVLSLLAGDAVQLLPFILFGTYGSWLYLRFFQTRSESNLRGDPSDEFGFDTFFPEVVRPAIRPVTTILSKIFCGRRSAEGEEGTGHILGGKPLPGSDPAEATRRRERGARALEERLAAAAQNATGAADGGASSLPVSSKPPGMGKEKAPADESV
ncbi:hypothetical protein KFL_008260030 [Klebsormidium nitens]|uniref:Uncharacterized protein n=1 Tax=Klebsormidium nitens TaxID=105231 RepID=A0A1Y1IQY1_KLENI|nr:hypothetical protein KFL_008260030 [Klebsormidium nitens]|eukprot:GAQ91651.1 hypothetical protein KFL_008260030 [Klebsormidium nitens]